MDLKKLGHHAAHGAATAHLSRVWEVDETKHYYPCRHYAVGSQVGWPLMGWEKHRGPGLVGTLTHRNPAGAAPLSTHSHGTGDGASHEQPEALP